MCERWQIFENFLADLGRKPGPDHRLSRVDLTRDFAPGNTLWEPVATWGTLKRALPGLLSREDAQLLSLAGKETGMRPSMLARLLDLGLTTRDLLRHKLPESTPTPGR